MTKLDIINRVVEKAGLPKPQAEEAVELIIEKIKETLGKGEAVVLRRFGSFSVRNKNTRIGRNPKTGEEAEISARSVVRFKSGKYFKDAVNKQINKVKPSEG
ncbi:MAG: DNA-binding protein [Nitrospinae bacterium RIFCSPLOWO2_12_39_16]|nr:MAG: DNA-binding protein [Nitrospinae bacterium RIFCSPLOWO2_12_39_16]HLA48711.1 integration host factor subunit alpha [Nitrospinota bacterium]